MEIILYGLVLLIVIFPFNVLPSILSLGYLLGYEKYFLTIGFKPIAVVTVCLYPIAFLSSDHDKVLDCCGPNMYFAPESSLTLYLLVFLCMVGFCISIFKSQLLPPIIEVLLLVSLIVGIILNILIGFHIGVIGLLGNLPIGLLFLAHLVKHQRELNGIVKEGYFDEEGLLKGLSAKLLKSSIFIKYPILIVLCIPVIIICSIILILFGQKPDALVTVFTDTYRMGFSQLDYQCENVNCGGHYLCSVAANGHPAVVNPIRYGKRSGSLIICNRQLLISNAFEGWVQEKIPKAHQVIRKYYDKVGDHIHDNHTVYKNKLLSDFIYLMMKPLEWCFVLFLYSVEVRPEDRIARQYIDPISIAQYDCHQKC